MSEIRTNVIISEESNEYRSKINLSVANLDNNLYDNHSAFRTNINISTTLKDGSIQSIKTILELGNISLDFYLVDMTKLNQSILYFSKFFNIHFEPEVMWNLLSQGTNEQINISHLSEALSSYAKKSNLEGINSSLLTIRSDLDNHRNNTNKHLSVTEKDFLNIIMRNPPWINGSGGTPSYIESFFELIELENGEYAVIPKKYNGKNVGIISNTFITAGGINSDSSNSEITFNRLDSWENYDESAGDVLSAILGFDLKQRIELIERNGTLNETQLSAYLSKNKYLTRTVADTIYSSLNSFEEFKKEIESKILWEKINIGTETSPIWAVIPKDINGNSVGVISNTFITAGGINSNNSSSQILTLGNLINVNDSVDNIEENSVILVKEASSTEWSVKLLSDIGFNESQLSEFLIRNEYLKKSTADTTYASLSSFNTLNNKFTDFLEGSDTDSIINKWKELEAFLEGQTESSTLADLLEVKLDTSVYNTFINNTFTNGAANNALKLGNQLPSYYATSSALNTTNTNLDNHITTYNNFVSATNNTLINHNNRLNSLENMFEWDGSKIKAKADFYSIGAVTAGGISDGGSIGNIFNRLDTWDNYNANSGDVLSAVLGYELKTRIDSIESSGVSGDYLPLSGGTIEGKLAVRDKLLVNTTDDYDYGLVVGGGVFWRGPQFGVYEHGGNIDWLDATPNSANAWNNTPWNSLRCQTSSNVLAIIVNAIAGNRKAYIQVGDAEITKSNLLGSLYLNPYGGTVYIGKNEAIHAGNIDSYITGGGNPAVTTLARQGQSVNINSVTQNAFTHEYMWSGTGSGQIVPYYGIASVLDISYSPDWRSQLYFKHDATPQVWLRSRHSGTTWTEWYELITSRGGTINGTLVVQTTSNGGVQITQNGINGYSNGNYENLHLNINSPKNVSLCYGGGNVLIGTTTDNGGKLQVEGTIKSVGGSNGSAIALLASGHVRVYAKTTGDTAGGVKFYTNDGSTLLGTPAGVFGANTGVKRYYYGGDYNTASMYIFANGNVSIGGSTTDMGTKLYINGNFVTTGSITHGSDIRYKAIDSHADIDLETIANAPIINFRWTNREDDRLYLGSSAQYWYNTSLCNGVIPTEDEKLWTMGYGEIAVAGLVSVAKKVVNHEDRLQVVEKELAEYKVENKQLKQQLNEYWRLS